MTPGQITKTNALDRQAKTEHAAAMRAFTPTSDPNVPPLLRMLDSDFPGFF